MSSTNDTYHHLLVQTQPKSILKKSPSPRFIDSKSKTNTFDSSTNPENDLYSNIISPSHYEAEKNDIEENRTNSNHVCIHNDNQPVMMNNSNLSAVEIPLTKLTMTSNPNLYQYEIDSELIRNIPPADLSSSLTSDDEQQQQQQRKKKKPKKLYYQPLIATGALSSSASSNDNNEQNNGERKAKRSMVESKTTSICPNKHRQKDMQLDEFMRKYQHQGGIYVPTKEKDHDKEQITTKEPINNDGNIYHQSSSTKQQNFHINKRSTSHSESSYLPNPLQSVNSMNADTINLLHSIDMINLSSKSISPLQLLFDVARKNELNRRIKIDKIRQYVEEQIGISAFLTIYKLIKSSQIPIDIKQKPFCYYISFIPHLCCLIMLENEQQKNRF